MRYRFEPIVDPEFESLIPPLSDEEFKQLEKNILEEGECHDPLMTWNKVLLDGHNRWRIIQNHPGELDYGCQEMIFFSRNEAMAWMIRNQLGRRNLPPYERARLALRLKEAIAAEAKENQGARNDICQKSDKSPIDTKKELAKVAGVSHDTIHKVDVIEQKAPEEVKKKLQRGEVSINRAYNDIREAEKTTDSFDVKNPPRKIKVYGEEELKRDVTAILADCIERLHQLIDSHQDIATDNPNIMLDAINDFNLSMDEIKDRLK